MTGRLIVHLAPFLQGGAGRIITSLVAAARRRTDRVVVAASATAEPGFENYAEYLRAIAEAGAELVLIDSLFKRDAGLNAAALSAIATAIGDERPAIVHAHAAVAADIGIRLGAPVIQTMHGWGRNKTPAQVEQDFSIMSRVDLVAFPSQAARQELVDLGARFRRTDVVANGIPAEAAGSRSTFDELQRLRQHGTQIIVTIGSLTRQKNHAVLVDALPAIAARRDVRVVLVGEGPDREALERLASARGVAHLVQYRGYLEDASSILQAADLFVQPSLTESFGLAVLEAYRARVPVVASRIPALVELAGDTGCGWMFDPSSPSELAEQVIAALGEDGERTERAHALFLSQFTIDRTIDRYDALYESVR